MINTKIENICNSIIESLKEDGLYKDERIIKSPQSGNVTVVFPAGSEEKNIINLCSNNYLGLSSHTDVISSAHNGLDSRGYGMSSVRFICGTQDIHKELENKVSRFLGMEDTILFSSCFDANAALFEALLSSEDAVFSDKLVHASIIDGIKLSKAKRNIYEHSDMDDLESKLKADSSRIKMIITDGVFSMDGDMAKLDLICDLADKYDAIVAVDDSHATGFIGKNGKGSHEYFSVMDRVDIIITTFGKALGGATGGCISSRKEIVELLRQKARPYLFSNSIMPAVVNACIKVIDILEQSTDLRDNLERKSEKWRDMLGKSGFDLKPGNTPIVPVMLYDAMLAQHFSYDLYMKGIYAVSFSYPVVAKGEARIRTQMSVAINDDDLDKALDAFTKVGKKHGVIR